MDRHHYIRHREFSDSSKLSTPERKSSLFESKVRRRLLRVLIDQSIDGQDEGSTLVRELLRHPLIKIWEYDFSEVEFNDTGSAELERQAGTLSVLEVTGKQGIFEFPGLNFSYAYSEVDDDIDLNERGWFNIGSPAETFVMFEIPNPTAERKQCLKDLQILSGAADAVGADLVLTNRHIDCGFPLTKLGITQLVSPVQAVATVAHYLRSQGEFVVGVSNIQTSNGEFYYREALLAYAPHIEHWMYKVIRAAELGDVPGSRSHIPYIQAVLSRFERALRRFDDLVATIGRPLSPISVDDSIDTLDHILVSLCGGVDALARSVGAALDLKRPKYSKLHIEDWVKANLETSYGHAPEFQRLLDILPRVKFVFDLRNSIHEVALMPYFDEFATNSDSLDRIKLIIPPSYQRAWEDLGAAESNEWKLRVDGNVAYVDLLHFAVTALESVFAYVDTLCELIAFEQVGESRGVLYENIRSVRSDDELSIPKFIAQTGFFRSPLLDGSYSPGSKRELETDLKSVITRRVLDLAQKAGLIGTGEFEYLSPLGIIRTHFERSQHEG